MKADAKNSSLREAALLGEQGAFEKAWRIVGDILNDDPNDVQALVTGSWILLRLGALPQAYHFAKAATRIAPKDDAAWTNLGHAESQMWLVKEAEASYRKALEHAPNLEHKKVLWLNLGALYLDNGQFEKAEALTRQLLAVEPTRESALANLGFCQLARHEWDPGWKNYRRTIGSEWRKRTQFKDEPEWDGTPGQTVILYGEQGLGDEVSFASMVPGAIEHCKKVILECDSRLAGLFKRSFPKATVYGTRSAKHGQWAREDWDFDASLPVGQLGEYYRTKDADFPGTAYLKPCPVRKAMWQSLFNGPTVGIAWSGGMPKSNARNRKFTLEQMLPLFKRGVKYVSLQYKDAQAEIDAFEAKHPWVDLVQYPWATLTADYDDTAALVAALDQVICMQTAIAHTAGALGVPTIVLVPTATQWRYGLHDSVPWYSSVKVVRQKIDGSWEREIGRAADLAGLSGRATEAARDGDLRGGFNILRPNGLSDHRAAGSHAPS